MILKYLGTSAFEGIPSLFCNCKVCRESRKLGGKSIRSRSQALIDGTLLIDFNADTVMHFQKYGLDIQNIKHCLITHSHSDHLYAEDFDMIGSDYSHPEKGYVFNSYGSQTVTDAIRSGLEYSVANDPALPLRLHTVKAFDTFTADKYIITAYPAFHDEASGPLFYSIYRNGKNILYAHDSGYFSETVWKYFKTHSSHFDLVSLDCTSGNQDNPGTHMGFVQNLKIKERMLSEGYADKNTVFISNHFSHNGKDVLYNTFMPIALEKGFLTSYDGMEIEI